jgi:voltage-gated sodium channel
LTRESSLVDRIRHLVESSGFQRAVLGLIIANAVFMGLETWAEFAQDFSLVFQAAHGGVQVAFIVELGLRILAHGRRPLTFFTSGWNVFDFGVVMVSLLPMAGPFATVVRLARVLRVARLVTGMPELRLIVGTMLKSIPSMGHVVMLLGLLMYVYGVVGYHLFARVDPEGFGSLGRAVRTLFVIITLEGWVEIMQRSEQATAWASAYYVSFIVVAVFVVINLFIAVVIDNLEKVRAEEAVGGQQPALADTPAELRRLSDRIQELELSIRSLSAGARAAGLAVTAPPKVGQEHPRRDGHVE